MKKRDLINEIVRILKENDLGKHVYAYKNILHISDDEGNKTDFTVKRKERDLVYTGDDVEKIIDAMFAAIIDSLKRGEEIDIRGIGVLKLVMRGARDAVHPGTNEIMHVPAHYVPKFNYGLKLKTAARVYEESLGDAFEPTAGLIEDMED